MLEPKVGELWVHRLRGYTCLITGIKDLKIAKKNRTFVETKQVNFIRTDCNLKSSEMINVFNWHFELLSDDTIIHSVKK